MIIGSDDLELFKVIRKRLDERIRKRNKNEEMGLVRERSNDRPTVSEDLEIVVMMFERYLGVIHE